MLRRIRDFTRKLRAGADAATRSEYLLKQIHQTQLMAAIVETPRFKDPLRLHSSGYKVFSTEPGGRHDRRNIPAYRHHLPTVRFRIEDGLFEGNSTFRLVEGWTW